MSRECHCVDCGALKQSCKGTLCRHCAGRRSQALTSPRSLSSRFWEKVKKGDGCWEWQASALRSGYGAIGRGSRSEGVEGAHRVSWQLHFGPIPDGLCVLHRCDNRLCVRPDHLFLGTRVDNIADMWAKGRSRWQREAA